MRRTIFLRRTRPNVPASKNQVLFTPIAVAIIATVGVIAGAGLTAYAAMFNSKQLRIESCINRFDIQEQQIRAKSEAFLGDIGDFIGASAKADNDFTIMYEPGRNVIASALKLTAYSSPEITKVALNIAAVVDIGLTATTHDEKEKALYAATTAFAGWNHQYATIMSTFQANRDACLNQ